MMKILLADDEEPCRQLLSNLFLREHDVDFIMARDGAEAWWLLTAPGQQFDLGIFDLRMPVVDGLALIDRIRSSPTWRRLPVILCTGISDRDTIASAGRLAIDHYIVKPYKPSVIRAKVLSFYPFDTGHERV